MTSNLGKWVCALVTGAGFILHGDSHANTMTCGLKTVTLSGNKVTKIVHEDGTVHEGASVSGNWTYDGKEITHRLLGTAIPCGTKAKSRDEVIAELSGQFSKNPKSYGMTPQEANLMGAYVAKLMRSDANCHLLVDAAKSTSRQGMFYVDCNDRQSKTKRFWLSESDLKAGTLKKVASTIPSGDAITICNAQLKAKTTNPSTYDPSLTLGTRSQVIEGAGRNVVEIEFKAGNALGVTKNYLGRCILEGGAVIELTVKDR